MDLDNIPDEQIDEGLDFRQYLSLFWHWAWLIALSALVASAVAYFFSQVMTPYYESSTTVLVNEAPATQATDYSSVMMSRQLASTYAQMIAKTPVLEQVASQLNLELALEDLEELVTVTLVRDTQLIRVTVESTDAQLSADIANTIADVFSAQIQEIQSQRFAQSKATLEAQLSELEEQIAIYESQADDPTTSVDEKARLDARVTQYRQIYSSLLQSYESIRLSEAQSVSSVVQVEPATPYPEPVRPKVLQNTLLAAVVGLLLAAGAIVAREALDDTIKTPEEINSKFRLPVLGVINHHKIEGEDPITLTDPRSPTAEAYRTLRTNVNYASVDEPLHTLLVTSAEPGEGKTTTISNLAIVLAQNGKKVIVADCDLRHPRLHTTFRVHNHRGISNLIAQPSVVLDGSRQPTRVINLSVVTTGSLPPNPAELLGSKKMQRVLSAISQSADMVLLDTPPILAVTDAAVLATSVEGVLLVVRPGKTRASALRQTLEQLHQVKANVIGVVINDVSTRGAPYGYRYSYYPNHAAYKDYYSDNRSGKEGSKVLQKWGRRNESEKGDQANYR